MSRQSRAESLLEATANSIVAMSYAVLFYWYIFGFTIAEGLSTTVFFAVAGFIRVYWIRRVAEWLRHKRDTA